MSAGNQSDLPNPFARNPRRRRSERRPLRVILRERLSAPAKYFVLVATALAVTIAIGVQSQKILVHQLTADFDQLPPALKKQRLLQIGELDLLAIDPLVAALADQDEDVARSAYDILKHSQDEWTLLTVEDQQQRHRLLVQSLDQVAEEISDDRTGWITGLLDRMIIELVDDDQQSAQQLYAAANTTRQRFDLAGRSASGTQSEPAPPSMVASRINVRPQPLPVTSVGEPEDWVDWPPKQESPKLQTLDVDNLATSELIPPPPSEPVQRNVLRPTTPMQPVPDEQSIVLQQWHQDGLPDSSQQSESQVSPVGNLVESPMQTLTDRSVMRWLTSPHQYLYEQAKLEMIRRGFTTEEINVAQRIHSEDATTRMQMVDRIARSKDLDPRPWLLLMLEDENREVQLRVISVLATMNDPNVRTELQMRLSQINDPIVAEQLRRVIER